MGDTDRRLPIEQLERRAQTALEWGLVLEALADRTHSDPGRRRLLELAPASTVEQARARMARVRATLVLGEHGVELPGSRFPDVQPTLQRLALGAAATGTELVDVQRVLEQAKRLRELVDEHAAVGGALSELLTSDPQLDRLTARLAAALEPDGEVANSASPALAQARGRARELTAELRRRLNDLVQRFGDVLSGGYYTERDGRYVLPVRSDAHYRVEGIVLGSSGSGGTLFVEPREVTDLGNRLRVQEAAVQREVARVLAELSAEVAARTDAVRIAFEACVGADCVAAIARFAVETHSRAIDVHPDDTFEITNARHPLLVLSGKPVVPNDAALGAGQALVVSGPNAGGKTVTLKCLGLFAWMVRAGIPVPAAEESRIGWFDHVLADVGDEQSLIRSLSTFSAHVESLAQILDHAGPHVLVLLDEVAAGTDPEEGAALAAAVLEALTAKGATVAATTHYERLKEQAAEPGPLQNASVGFDFSTLEPTFRLVLGVPGASSALAVAARYGLPHAVVQRAREILPRASIDRERVVLELNAERERLREEREALEADREAQRCLLANIAEEQARVHEEARERIEKEARELSLAVRAARTDLERARAELRRDAIDQRRLRTLENDISQVAAKVAVGGQFAPSRRSREGAPIDAATLVPGARVRLRSSGAIGTVLERPARGSVTLRVGALRLTQKVEELEPAPAEGRRTAAKKPKLTASNAALPTARRSTENTLDLRGVRVEDAAARIDAFLDRLLGEGEPVGFVLHGHGTGALRTRAREHLGGSSYVEHVRSAEADEGGEAFTVFWVR